MKISIEWLKDWIEFSGSPQELAEKLTLAGLEVEGVEEYRLDTSRIVVGQIKSIDKHPQADKLTVCRVNTGKEELQIVCGAKNMKKSDYVPVALIGAELPGGMIIKKSKLRGIDSYGMMCSSEELGIETQTDGLMILPQNLKAGTPVDQILSLNDTILEIGITPNRGDCLSHLGVAREVAALTGKKIKPPQITLKEEKESASNAVQIKIEAKDCSRYTGRVLKEVTVGPSPLWMQVRLARCGIRPINNIVDITNYVMLDCGQPMHAFDLSKIEGQKIIVRQAKEGERIVSLDEKPHRLGNTDMVIADAKKPVALAGVMGGKESEVSGATTEVLLESAYFSPEAVRRLKNKIGLASESSYRFERGVDQSQVDWASMRAARLMQETAGAKVLKGGIDVVSKKHSPHKVLFHYGILKRILGESVKTQKVNAILNSLGLIVSRSDKEKCQVTIPSYRHDLVHEYDLIEEISRIYGYDQIPTTLPLLQIKGIEWSPIQILRNRVNEAFLGYGFNQAITYSFTSKQRLVPFFAPDSKLRESVIELANPVNEELRYLRPSLLPNLLGCAKHNQAYGNKETRLFETGTTYHPNPSKKNRTLELTDSVAIVSVEEPKVNWLNNSKTIDFYGIKGISESIIELLGIPSARIATLKENSIYHPGQAAGWFAGEKLILRFGQLHPLLLEHYKLEGPLFAIELILETICALQGGKKRYRSIPNTPKVVRDIALVVDEKIAEETVRKVFQSIESEILESFHLFDVYSGPQVPPGKKSLAYSLHFRDRNGTLTDELVDAEHQKIHTFIQDQLQCEFRS